MYQHPQALYYTSVHYQQEALRDAQNRKLVAEAHAAEDEHSTQHRTPVQRRMVAMAVALVTVLGLVLLVI